MSENIFLNCWIVGDGHIVFYKASISRDDEAFEDKVAGIITNTEALHPYILISDVFPAPVVDERCIHLICTRFTPKAPVSTRSDVAALRSQFLNAWDKFHQEKESRTSERDQNQQHQSQAALYEANLASHRIPCTLLHPIFGQFVDDCETHRPVAADNRLVCALKQVMCDIDHDEREREAKILRVFKEHGMDLEETGVPVGDGRGRHRYTFVVVKKAMWYPGAEPYFGGGQLYLESARNAAAEVSNCVLPSMLLRFFGPCVGFAGAAWTGRHNLQSLSVCLPMHYHPTDTDLSRTAARHLGALRSALQALKAYYRDSNSLSSPVPRDINFPYPSYFTSQDSTKRYFKYVSHPFEDRLIFFGKLLDSGEDICIKFVEGYARDAHAFCAAKGLAPALHGFEKLPGGWYMAVMDRLPDDYVGFCDLPEVIRETWTPRFDRVRLEAIREMNEANIVHGDLDNTKVMVKEGNEGMSFMLVDFGLLSEVERALRESSS